MSLSFRRRQRHRRPGRLRWTRVLLILGIVVVAAEGLLVAAGPVRVRSWMERWGAGSTLKPVSPPALVALYDPTAAVRSLTAAQVAPPTCCTLARIARRRGDEGCSWQVAFWRDATPLTQVPAACPAGVTPFRDDPSIRLRGLEREKGVEGCLWYAARWSDGITTRVPASCPAAVQVARRALPHAQCYGSAPDAMGSPPPRSAAHGSLFRGCRIVSFYGYPDLPMMGALGRGGPDEVVARLLDQALAYERAAPDRPAVPAFHLVTAVAQAGPQPDGTYLQRMSPERMQRWVDIAEREDFLVFLDIQVGHSTPIAELEPILPLLRNPRVHLALDPEFAMPPGVVPGREIGSLSAGAINEVQAALQRLVIEEGLPNKILLVHQFQDAMITDRSQLEEQPGVDLVIDMDGFGPSATKIAHYNEFVIRGGAEFGGIKLFLTQDLDLMAPEAVLELGPELGSGPDVVIYQ